MHKKMFVFSELMENFLTGKISTREFQLIFNEIREDSFYGKLIGKEFRIIDDIYGFLHSDKLEEKVREAQIKFFELMKEEENA